MSNSRDLYTAYLSDLKNNTLFRELPSSEICFSSSSPLLIDFSTNDYLGLSSHPLLKEKLCSIVQSNERDIGATGSRLLSGTKEVHLKLEASIAQAINTEKAIIFPSGYQCNIGVLSALLNPSVNSLVFFDKANHASLYDAVFLSQAFRSQNSSLIRYAHNNLNHLEYLLKKYESRAPSSLKFIVTETIFSMDGDMVDLESLAYLSQKYNAFLYLDEAHAVGVFGLKGYGLSSNISIKCPHVIMGTFSKALGLMGGYIGTDSITHAYLVNMCRSFMYSTSLPPFFAELMLFAWESLPSFHQARADLMKIALYGHARKPFGSKIESSKGVTPIISLLLSNAKESLDLASYLKNQGILVSAIRYPTVSKTTPRIRLSLQSRHTKSDIDQCYEAIVRYFDRYSLSLTRDIGSYD